MNIKPHGCSQNISIFSCWRLAHGRMVSECSFNLLSPLFSHKFFILSQHLWYTLGALFFLCQMHFWSRRWHISAFLMGLRTSPYFPLVLAHERPSSSWVLIQDGGAHILPRVTNITELIFCGPLVEVGWLGCSSGSFIIPPTPPPVDSAVYLL